MLKKEKREGVSETQQTQKVHQEHRMKTIENINNNHLTNVRKNGIKKGLKESRVKRKRKKDAGLKA